jgi:hypothetical protein
MASQNDFGLSHYEMPYGLPYLRSFTDVPFCETKDYFLKTYILGLSSTLLCLRKKRLLAPLDFPVHQNQPSDHVLIKNWKENKPDPAWEGPFLVLLTMETVIQTA